MSENSHFFQKLFVYPVFLLCLMLLLLPGCRTTSIAPVAGDDDTPVTKYTRYNIHAQQNNRDIKASYAGFVDPGAGHIFVPAGSKVQFPDKRALRNGFFIKVVDTGQEIFFEYNKGRMKMPAHEYVELITSDKPVSLDHFSAIDRKGIKDGKAYEKMSKEGVLTALGYPPTHGTPSLESNTWKYWRNRFVTMNVVFDETGHVKNIVK